jgi:hypothetical protein
MSDPRADRDAYLDQVAARLRLPEDHVRDVIEELQSHLAATVEGLLDEGLTPDQAERESIARLGDPGELADGIRHARQSRRRLLAAAGSGAVAAVGGVVWGYVFAVALATIAGVLATILISIGLKWLNLSTPGGRPATDILSIPFALFIPAYGAQRMVGAVADRAARPVSAVRWPIAVVGGALLAVVALFLVPTDDGPIGILVLLTIPVGFVIGALSARGRTAARLRRLPARRVVALVVLTTLTLVVASASTMRTYSGDGFAVDEGLSHLPPPATDVIGEGWINQQSSIGERPISAVTLELEPATLLDGWRDLRLEAWPATDPMTLEVAPVADHPSIVAPMTRDEFGAYAAQLDLGISKMPRWFVVVTTGVAPDGTRYLLTGPDGPVPSRPWTGTVWEYLTTP